MLKCQDPVLFGVLPLCIQRAARVAATLILILPGKPLSRLAAVLTEPFSAYGTFEPYAGFVEAQSIAPRNPIAIVLPGLADTFNRYGLFSLSYMMGDEII